MRVEDAPEAGTAGHYIHVFRRDVGVASKVIPHNGRLSNRDPAQWPPSALFNFTYGSVVLKHWGVAIYVAGL